MTSHRHQAQPWVWTVTPKDDNHDTQGADGHSSIKAASAGAWEESTWSTRSAASMNDVDADERRHRMGRRGGALPSGPWVLIDDLTVDQTACLLERLTAWLTGPDTRAAARCTRALTLGETHDPVSLASWADALAARLRHRAEDSQIDPNQLTD